MCNLITLLFVITIPSLISLIRVWGDMILMIGYMQYCLPVSIAIFKVCIIWYNQEVLADLIDVIEGDWVKVRIKEERDLMLRCARITRTITMCGLFLVFFIVTVVFGLPCLEMIRRYITNLTNSEKHLPVPIYYPHDVTKSPQFELTLLAQTIAALIAGISYTGTDNLFGLLVFHVCGQLENLHLRLKHMKKFPNYDEILKYNVQNHICLIRSIKMIDDTFNLMLLTLVLYFAITFCLQGFLIVNSFKHKDELSVMELVWFVVATVTSSVHMCLYCAVGEILVIQSEKIHHATYEFEWYTIEPKAAKNLILIMLRANKPLYITAGKTFPMTMATFCSLLKTSAGYISVLLAKQD
ncbi:odorant receptor 43a-like [Odontomachus brunneus]|uniref:odorant receptor 43a-like n=1 Tax=Odontomachus brunneus TaxID=486640 RepID=UPI0013F20062|nr:odorant receptor 43a-like [Odontomachus brunneus]